MYFDGILISGDDFGNINMAYVGVKMGLSHWIYQNILTTDGKDSKSIEFGINMATDGK